MTEETTHIDRLFDDAWSLGRRLALLSASLIVVSFHRATAEMAENWRRRLLLFVNARQLAQNADDERARSDSHTICCRCSVISGAARSALQYQIRALLHSRASNTASSVTVLTCRISR